MTGGDTTGGDMGEGERERPPGAGFSPGQGVWEPLPQGAEFDTEQTGHLPLPSLTDFGPWQHGVGHDPLAAPGRVPPDPPPPEWTHPQQPASAGGPGGPAADGPGPGGHEDHGRPGWDQPHPEPPGPGHGPDGQGSGSYGPDGARRDGHGPVRPGPDDRQGGPGRQGPDRQGPDGHGPADHGTPEHGGPDRAAVPGALVPAPSAQDSAVPAPPAPGQSAPGPGRSVPGRAVTGPAVPGRTPASAPEHARAGQEPPSARPGEPPRPGEAQDGDVDSGAPQAPVPAPHLEHPLASYVLRVNGADRPVADAWLGESLLYVLRERLGLAGAKDGCEQGECGACSVQVDGRLVAACLVPAGTAAGCEVRTVEGLPSGGEPSDVQRALAGSGAVQCGYCVPGLAMAVHDLLSGNHNPTELQTRQALSGNLCRCTGYRGVLAAVREVIASRDESESAGPSRDGGDTVPVPQQAQAPGPAPGPGGQRAPDAQGHPGAGPVPHGPHESNGTTTMNGLSGGGATQ